MPFSPQASDYTGPVLVTLAYVLLYYVFQLYIMQVKKRLHREYRERGEKFDRYFSQDREMLAADRTQLNMLEHMGPFLVLLWLNAVFVSTTSATVAGAIYVVARVAYPFVMGGRLGRDIQTRIMYVTFTGYAVIAWYSGALLWALGS